MSQASPLALPRANPSPGGGVAGAVFSLAGLAITAAATIAVFFGVGLTRLLDHPAAVIRTAPASAAAPGIPPGPRDASQVAVLAPQPAVKAPQPAAKAPPPAAPVLAAQPSPPSPTPPPDARADAAAPPPVVGMPAHPPAAPAPAPPAATTPAAPAPPPPAVVATTVPPPAEPEAAKPATASPTPAPAARPTPLKPLSAAQIAALLAAGDAAFRRGDLAAARLSYRRVYEAGEGRGALGIGASYDPLFLSHFHVARERADPAEARVWYERARELGAAEAGGRLDRLAAKPPQ